MRKLFGIVLMIVSFWLMPLSGHATPSPVGSQVYFDNCDNATKWSPFDTSYNGTHAYNAVATAGSPTAWIWTALDSTQLSNVQGSVVRLSAWIKASAVGNGGLKLMLIVTNPGGTNYPNVFVDPTDAGGTVTFGWRRLYVYAAIPADATAVTIVTGIQNSVGTALFDDVKLETATQRGQEIYHETYENTTTYPNWIVSENGTHAYKAFGPNATGQADWKWNYLTPTQLDQVKGAGIKFSSRITATGVNPSGFKFMLEVISPSGTVYPGSAPPGSTFGWTTLQEVTGIPADATSVAVITGIFEAGGTAAFEDTRLEIVRPKRIHPVNHWTESVYTGHSEAHLLGLNAEPALKDHPDGVSTPVAWNANVIRMQLWDHNADTDYTQGSGNWTAFDTALNTELTKLDTYLAQIQSTNIKILVDLHTPPGGFDNSSLQSHRIFEYQEYQDKLVSVWQMIANRYKGNTHVWGYDLVNEPMEIGAPKCSAPNEMIAGWNELAERVADKVWHIDPDHAIIVEPELFGAPNGFDCLEPLSEPNVVYSVHVYDPIQYTHQGVISSYPYPFALPANTLSTAVAPARSFQTDYNAAMFVGEFSAARWAPSAEIWLSNAMELFDSYGWDWAYHAFRQAYCWSIEADDTYTVDQSVMPAAAPNNPREQTLWAHLAQTSLPFASGNYRLTSASVTGSSLGVSTTAGSNIPVKLLTTSTTAATQKWTFAPMGNGYYTVKLKGTNLALEVVGGANANANVQLNTTNGSAGQKWGIVKNGTSFTLTPLCSPKRLLNGTANNAQCNSAPTAVTGATVNAPMRWTIVTTP